MLSSLHNTNSWIDDEKRDVPLTFVSCCCILHLSAVLKVYICACMSYIQRGKSEKENFSLEDIKMAGVAACRLLDLFKADCQPVYTHLCKTAESLCDAIVPAAKDKWLSLTPSIEKLDTDDYERIGKVLEEKDSEIASKLLQTYCSDAMNVSGKSFLMKVSEELKRKTFPSKQGDKQKAILTGKEKLRLVVILFKVIVNASNH